MNDRDIILTMVLKSSEVLSRPAAYTLYSKLSKCLYSTVLRESAFMRDVKTWLSLPSWISVANSAPTNFSKWAESDMPKLSAFPTSWVW